MKPLILLIAVFLVSLGILQFTGVEDKLAVAGNVAMALMLCFTALGHFKFADGMAAMIPPFVPQRRLLVLLSGLFEIVLAIGLLFRQTRSLTAIVAIVFLLLILPANIYAARHRINYEKGTFDGAGVRYLWFRVPLQALFIAWLYYFSV
jgi:uncharacterized membrane protein